MKLFTLNRKIDESGTSGFGTILDGVVFDDETTVVKWRKSRSFGHGISNISIFNTFDDFLDVHVNSHAPNSNEIQFKDE